jgi:phosphoribosyl-dephospho-CoA transferase
VTADLGEIRRALLAARDSRQARLDAFLARVRGTRSVVAITTSIPGSDKWPVGADLLVGAALEQLDTLGWLGPASGGRRLRRRAPGGPRVSSVSVGPGGLPGAPPLPHDHGEDILGEFIFLALDVDPRVMKRRYAIIENYVPWGRLLDIDVYDVEGRPVSRPDVGLPSRECLLCEEPARDCMRLGRHTEGELRVRVEAALRFLEACLIEH